MRILIASPFRHANEGVLGLYADGLREAFQKQGHRVEISSPNSFERTLPSGLRHIVYGARITPGVLSSDLVLALDSWSVGFPALLATRIFRKRFGIRIGGDFLWESYVARTKEPILLSEFYKIPRKLTFKEKMISRGIRFLTQHADALLFTTHFQKDLWQEAYGFKAERAHIVENYFPQKSTAHPPVGRVFVSAGRKIFLKNADALGRAFTRVKANADDISLDVSSVSHKDHLKRLSSAYAVIIPTFSEVCSNTAIEAVAHGKPFIMTSDTGTKERLSECGIFIDTRNEAELEKAIEKILEESVYEGLLARIRAFSHAHSWEHMAEEIIRAVR